MHEVDERTDRPTAGSSNPVRGVAVHVLLVAASFVMLYPLLWMFAASFKPQNEIFSSPSLLPQHFTVAGYVSGWSGLSVNFGLFFLNSLTISGLSIVGNLVACSLAAFAFARLDFPGRRTLFAVLLLTMMLPYHVTLIPQYIMFFNIGWVNTLLPLVVPKFLAVDAFF